MTAGINWLRWRFTTYKCRIPGTVHDLWYDVIDLVPTKIIKSFMNLLSLGLHLNYGESKNSAGWTQPNRIMEFFLTGLWLLQCFSSSSSMLAINGISNKWSHLRIPTCRHSKGVFCRNDMFRSISISPTEILRRYLDNRLPCTRYKSFSRTIPDKSNPERKSNPFDFGHNVRKTCHRQTMRENIDLFAISAMQGRWAASKWIGNHILFICYMLSKIYLARSPCPGNWSYPSSSEKNIVDICFEFFLGKFTYPVSVQLRIEINYIKHRFHIVMGLASAMLQKKSLPRMGRQCRSLSVQL
jgi:hypothetical protein